MQRNRFDCKLMYLFTKVGNLEASMWGFPRIFIEFSKQPFLLLTFASGWAAFRKRSFGFVRRKNLQEIIVFTQSNFVNAVLFFFKTQTGTWNITWPTFKARIWNKVIPFFCQLTTLNNKTALILPGVWRMFASQVLLMCIFWVSRRDKFLKAKEMLHSEINPLQG